jgi:hypothetical protein
MAVSLAFEAGRGALVTNVSAGRDPRLDAALEGLGVPLPHIASADFISVVGDETRIIEVKGRGSSGPVSIIERERDTFAAAGSTSWLYVVWNTTQPPPYRLIIVQDPQRLPWVQTRQAEREPGSFRGTRHEAAFQCQSRDVERLGIEVDLTGLQLPAKG